MSVIVAGIGTEVGKTVISAILCQTLKADYWKPVQAGDLNHTDADKVKALVTQHPFTIHPETYRLTAPMSPHAAAELDGIMIQSGNFKPPNVDKPSTESRRCIIELAGGLMVPLSQTYLMVDLIEDLNKPIILVANSYLGSINHTLLSLELIRQRKLDFLGLIFNGNTNFESREIILNYSNAPLIADIPQTQTLTKDFVKTHADKLQNHPRLARLR